MDPFVINFVFGDGTTHDASVSEASASQQICFKHFWSIIPLFNNLDKFPVYTIEVSNDNINFVPYDDRVEDADIDQGFDDTHFNFIYVRINYDAKINGTGTVSFSMILKIG